MALLSAADKRVLQSWLTDLEEEKEHFSEWTDEKYNGACAQWFSEHHTRAAMIPDDASRTHFPRRGGSSFCENFDDFYHRFCVGIMFEDYEAPETLRIIKLLKGLHRSPEIPCTMLPHGVVAVSLDATTQFLSTYFDTPCELIEGTSFGLKFGDSDELETLLEPIVRNLTAFRDRSISLRVPFFQSSAPPLPGAFADDNDGSPPGSAAAVDGVGGASAGGASPPSPNPGNPPFISILIFIKPRQF